MPDAVDLSPDGRPEGRPHGFDAAIAALARAQYGVVTDRQLAALGLAPRAIQYLYAVGHRALRREAAWKAATLVCSGAVLSHHSAAALWGIRGEDRARADVTVPRTVRPRDRLEIHCAQLPRDEITVHERIAVTTPARTLLDLAATLTPQPLERAATEAEIRRLGSPTSLADLVARSPRRPGTPAVKRLLEQHAIGRHITKRELELRFLACLDDHRLPRPRVNATVEGREVDGLWPDQRLIVEPDGFATHGTRSAFEHDRARDRALAVAGYRVVRITWQQLTSEPGLVAGQLRILLRQRRHAPVTPVDPDR